MSPRALPEWIGKSPDAAIPPRVRCCSECGNTFVMALWEAKRGRRFCSRQCKLSALHRSLKRNPLTRFFDNAIPEPNSGCFLWLGSYMNMGYGTVSINRKNVLAHRVSFELTFGPIPDGMNICHRCDNPACVNPDHLFLGTQADNIRDMVQKKRYNNVGLHGEEHPQAKIDAASVVAIRNDKRPVRAIASEYGLSASQISAIKNRKSWALVP